MYSAECDQVVLVDNTCTLSYDDVNIKGIDEERDQIDNLRGKSRH